MHPLIIQVSPVEALVFQAEFDNGGVRRYDVKPLISKISAFRELERITSLFNQIHVEGFGHAVAWNERLDLSAEEVWEHGEVVS